MRNFNGRVEKHEENMEKWMRKGRKYNEVNAENTTELYLILQTQRNL